MEINDLTGKVIGCAIEVHKHLGPGLSESVYEQCFAHELRLAGLGFELRKNLAIRYKGVNLDCHYRLGVVVEDALIVELKTVDKLQKIHEAQLLTYLKLSGISYGLLMNFNEALLKNGIKRMVC
ncbi:MAG: GxxExxY protein [Methylomicrobium sp.]